MVRRLVVTVGLVLAWAAPAAADPVPSYEVQGGGPVVAGEPATFVSTSQPDPGQLIDEVEWDFEGDGSFVSGNAPSHTYSEHGIHWLRMRVSDTLGPEEEAFFGVLVLARPVARIVSAPSTPKTGESVTLLPASYDADGGSLSHEWDLNDDGVFEISGNGPQSVSFPTAGLHRVGLRVTDSDGLAATIAQAIAVTPAPAPPGAPPVTPPIGPAGPRVMSPFPVVRMAGRVTRTGARISRLEVRAPRGARVKVDCAGAGCPLSAVTRRMGTRPIHFKSLERFHRAGTVLSISVTKAGQVGKHTRFVIRAKRPPKRKDACLAPGASKPTSCPSG